MSCKEYTVDYCILLIYFYDMKILIVKGNPKKENHTDSLANIYKDASEKYGNEVKMIDVYSRECILSYSNPEPNSSSEEDIAKIKNMQEMITWADELVIVHPIWWALMPAGLKNWIDAVFVPHFAYKYTPQGKVEKLLNGKTAKVIATAGSHAKYYNTPIVSFFTPLHLFWKYVIFGFCGIKLTELMVQDKMNINNNCPPEGCFEDFMEKVKISATRH